VRYLLDTNTVIGLLRAKNISVLARYAAVPRASICTCRLASVEEPYDDAWDAAWLEELERREQAVRDGGHAGDPWAEVRARVLARLGAR
jgi:predicted nucleic acid-binding protein